MSNIVANNFNLKPGIPSNHLSRISALNKLADASSRQNVERSLTKKLNLPNIPFPKSTSNNPEKKFTTFFKKREVEYDKNLRSIKSNLFENKFKNVSVNPNSRENLIKKGVNLKYMNKKNYMNDNKTNASLNTCNQNENRNLKVIRDRSRSATKKSNLMNELKTTPGESILEQSEKSKIDSEARSNLNEMGLNDDLKMKNEFVPDKFCVNNDQIHLNEEILIDSDNRRDYFNFNLIEDEGKDIKRDDWTKPDTLYIHLHEKQNQSTSSIYPEKIEKINRKNHPLDNIFRDTDENILDTNDHSLLELYMKDDLIFKASDLKTQDTSMNDFSKLKSHENLMTKSIDELFNIERLFENTIPMNSMEFPNTSERTIKMNSINYLKSQTFRGEFLNYNIFQESVNKINLGIFSLNFENLKVNREQRAKFTREEYRLLLSAVLRFDYGKGILDELHNTEESNWNALNRHEISERMRMKMIDWMIEVLANYKCEESTYFLAVNLMDRYFQLSKKSLKPNDLHLIGICCMFIASKFYDIYPIKLRVVVEKISHNKFAPEEIKSMEEDIVKSLNYNMLLPLSWDFVNFFLEEIFYFIENNFMIGDETLSEYIRTMCISGYREIKIDTVYYEKLKNTKKWNSTMMSLLKNIVLYLTKMNCHDYNFTSVKPSLIAASTLFVALKICGQINKEEYMNEYFFNKLREVSRHTEYDIIQHAQRILYNAQNFDKVFPNLENLKKVHFNHMLEIGYRENF